MPSFEDELTALFKKHGITSTSMLCYNDPGEVAKYNEEMDAYNKQHEAWQVKYDEWIKTNPEVPWPSRYIGYGIRANLNYDKELNAYNAWEAKMEAEVGPEPEKPYPDLIKEGYDDTYTPGVWYSSRC